MITSLKIDGYRSFKHLEMSGLGRINLLVGSNDSGKTSVLEAVYLLASGTDTSALRSILSGRGETLEPDGDLPSDVPQGPEYDVRHLFHGHKLSMGAEFTISASDTSDNREILYKIKSALPNNQSLTTSAALSIFENLKALEWQVCLTRRNGILAMLLGENKVLSGDSDKTNSMTSYVSTMSLSAAVLSRMWGEIVLTPNEESVLEALRIIDPLIERIAAILSPQYANKSSGGFIVKLKDMNLPIPIGSLGDGVWRLLAIMIALVKAQNGILLVDEIDAGLHYTVMVNMWKLIAETAKKLNVQVFSTTHSYDCISSLAKICREDVDEGSDVTIQRITSGRKKTVSYSEAEIAVAAEFHTEVR